MLKNLRNNAIKQLKPDVQAFVEAGNIVHARIEKELATKAPQSIKTVQGRTGSRSGRGAISKPVDG